MLYFEFENEKFYNLEACPNFESLRLGLCFVGNYIFVVILSPGMQCT